MATATASRALCALCKVPTYESLYSGERFGFRDRVCKTCYRRLDKEQSARLRVVKLESTDLPPPTNRYQARVTRKFFLEVLDPDFGLDDMTPRAMVQIILTNPATRRVFFQSADPGSSGVAVGEAPAVGGGALLPLAAGPIGDSL